MRRRRGVERAVASYLLGGILALGPGPASADVIRDGWIGPGPEVQPSSSPTCDFCIDQSLGERAGANLYHSFSQFDLLGSGGVGANGEQVASFFGSPGISNVIARITSGSPSAINGTITSQVGNLYLLNPAGVLFGTGARFDIPAALYVSSADALRFGTGNDFVVASMDPFLNPAEPAAFSFDTGPAGAVTFDLGSGAILDVNDGETITVVAGDVFVQNDTKVRSRGGLIQMAAVGEAAALVPLDLTDFDVGAQAGELGSIQVTGGSWINGSREGMSLPSNGRVVLRGGELVFTEGSVVRAGGDGTTPAVDLEAQRLIEVDGSFLLDIGGDQRAEVGIHMSAPQIELHDQGRVIATTFTGLAGNVEIQADQLELSGDSEIRAQTTGSEQGSDVVIDSRAVVVTSRAGDSTAGSINTFSSSNSSARPGSIQITTDSLRLEEGGQVGSKSESARTSGNVQITATDGSISMSGRDASNTPSGVFSQAAATSGSQPGDEAGNLTLEARTIDLEDGALVSARTFGEADAGSVRLTAGERISLRGGPERVTEISARGDDGRGGDVTLSAPEISLIDGGRISASTTGGGSAGSVSIEGTDRLTIAGSTTVGVATERSGILVETLQPLGGGDAGDLRIDVSESVTLRDGATLSVSTQSVGNGGSIEVRAGRRIRVAGGSVINSASLLEGRSGSITLEAGRSIVVDGSVIASTAETSQGGDITIRGRDGALPDVLINNGSLITAEAAGAGDAGSIRIEQSHVIGVLGSELSTRSIESGGGRLELRALEKVELVESRLTTDVVTGDGGGGDITIDPRFVVVNRSAITARAEEGPGGNILIVADTYLQSADSPDPDASSRFGLDGRVEIRTPDAFLVQVLTPLSQEFLTVTNLLPAPCAARMSEDRSSFVVRGRQGMPVMPDGYLPMPLPTPPYSHESEPQRDGDPVSPPERSLEDPATPGATDHRSKPGGSAWASTAGAPRSDCEYWPGHPARGER